MFSSSVRRICKHWLIRYSSAFEIKKRNYNISESQTCFHFSKQQLGLHNIILLVAFSHFGMGIDYASN